MRRLIEKVLDKVSALLPDFIPSDKAFHFIACFVPALFGNYNLAIGFAVGKEVGDMFAQGNRWSWGDILADGLGIVAGLACNYLLKYFTNHPIHQLF